MNTPTRSGGVPIKPPPHPRTKPKPKPKPVDQES
jgi:hypothetical protein